MTNKEFLAHLEYQARIHRELHGVNSETAVQAREALERAKELVYVEGTSGALIDPHTGAAVPSDFSRDGWSR